MKHSLNRLKRFAGLEQTAFIAQRARRTSNPGVHICSRTIEGARQALAGQGRRLLVEAVTQTLEQPVLFT